MEERRAPWPVLALATVAAAACAVAAGLVLLSDDPAPQEPDCTTHLECPTDIAPPFTLSVQPRYRGGPPGDLARDNAEYPVGTGPSDELLPGRWAAYPPGTDCKWTIQIPPAPGVEMAMVTQPDGRQEIQQTRWIAGSTETHWTPGTAIYIQLDAGVRFQTVDCGTWFRVSPRPSTSPRPPR